MQPDPIETIHAPVRSGRWGLRSAGVLAAILVIVLLGTASQLEPNSRGLGTHHQLGLPPCTIRVLFGIRCPSCGMTTSWAYFTRGDLAASAKVNLGGFLLAIYAVGSLAATIPMSLNGRWPNDRTIRNATIALLAVTVVTLADWIWRLTL